MFKRYSLSSESVHRSIIDCNPSSTIPPSSLGVIQSSTQSLENPEDLLPRAHVSHEFVRNEDIPLPSSPSEPLPAHCATAFDRPVQFDTPMTPRGDDVPLDLTWATVVANNQRLESVAVSFFSSIEAGLDRPPLGHSTGTWQWHAVLAAWHWENAVRLCRLELSTDQELFSSMAIPSSEPDLQQSATTDGGRGSCVAIPSSEPDLLQGATTVGRRGSRKGQRRSGTRGAGGRTSRGRGTRSRGRRGSKPN